MNWSLSRFSFIGTLYKRRSFPSLKTKTLANCGISMEWEENRVKWKILLWISTIFNSFRKGVLQACKSRLGSFITLDLTGGEDERKWRRWYSIRNWWHLNNVLFLFCVMLWCLAVCSIHFNCYLAWRGTTGNGNWHLKWKIKMTWQSRINDGLMNQEIDWKQKADEWRPIKRFLIY